ncbi:hypothetical protein CFP56_005154 [Quercus suber]|uniref:Uncharacterized protein n=1 Tax=Quercus suber TaxID=58331 RepID=A0AAW0LD96_QUESU
MTEPLLSTKTNPTSLLSTFLTKRRTSTLSQTQIRAISQKASQRFQSPTQRLYQSILYRGTEGENLGVEAARAGDFLKLSSLFVKIQRWVLVRMSLNCKLPSLNGRLPNCSKLKKAKERLHGSNSVRKWRRKLLFFFCLLVFVVLK